MGMRGGTVSNRSWITIDPWLAHIAQAGSSEGDCLRKERPGQGGEIARNEPKLRGSALGMGIAWVAFGSRL